MLIGKHPHTLIAELYINQSANIMINKKDESQSPAPKASGAKDTSESSNDEGNLKAQMAEAKKGAAKKTSATKTPQKIQDGNMSEKKTEY